MILRDVSLVDPRKVGANVTLLVELELERHRLDLLPSQRRNARVLKVGTVGRQRS